MDTSSGEGAGDPEGSQGQEGENAEGSPAAAREAFAADMLRTGSANTMARGDVLGRHGSILRLVGRRRLRDGLK